MTDQNCSAFKKAPYQIKEQGWGEFDMLITLTAVDKGGEFPLQHDLNFQQERYESKHPIVCLIYDTRPPPPETRTNDLMALQTFKNPKPGLLALLKESGPIPGDANGVKGVDSAKKKRRPDKGV